MYTFLFSFLYDDKTHFGLCIISCGNFQADLQRLI